MWYLGGFLVLLLVLMSQNEIASEKVEIINELGEVEEVTPNDLSGEAWRRRRGSSVQAMSCIETDQGKDKLTKGKNTYTYKKKIKTSSYKRRGRTYYRYGWKEFSTELQDSCITRGRLKGWVNERYCSRNKVRQTSLQCENGCQDGACVGQPQFSNQEVTNPGEPMPGSGAASDKKDTGPENEREVFAIFKIDGKEYPDRCVISKARGRSRNSINGFYHAEELERAFEFVDECSGSKCYHAESTNLKFQKKLGRHKDYKKVYSVGNLASTAKCLNGVYNVR